MQVDFSLLNQNPGNTPVGSLMGGLQTGLGFGQNQQMIQMKRQMMEQDMAQSEAAMQMRQQQMEQEKELKALATLKTKSEILSKPWFRRLDKQKKNEFFKSYIGDVNGALGTEYDGDGQFDDGDSDVAADIAQIVADKGLSTADKKAAISSRLLAAQSGGEDPQYLASVQKTAEMGFEPSMSPYQTESLGLSRERLELDREKKEDKLAGAANKKQTAQTRVSQNLETMASLYNELSEKGGIVDTSKGALANVTRRASASGIGQAVGMAFGTEEQSLRNRIKSIRPLLMNDIRQASEMGARGLDSEKELEFYLQAATDPAQDIQYNLSALGVLDRAYGLGLGVKGAPTPEDGGGGGPQPGAVPAVGGTFNGGKVLSVERVD
jgi:hypothetical protein